MSVREIAEAVKAPAERAPAGIDATGISTDTRSIRPGDLFVALKGENFDGHAYVAAAFDRGAVGAVVESSRIGSLSADRGILIGVPDTASAYGAIACSWRRRFSIPVVAVTGSVGKTTTKEMLAAALSSLGPILKTERNENNEIGVPQLLLRLTSEHKAVVVEMGMRGSGQITYLAGISEPTVGVITRIGENHIGILGSVEAIARAKGELVESLPAAGLAVLNADDPYTPMIATAAKCRVATFALEAPQSSGATIFASEYRRVPDGSAWTVRVAHRGITSEPFTLTSPSRHDVSNALAAILVSVELGVPLETAIRDVRGYQTVGMRMDIVTTPSGATILSDCYNASPTSTSSAVETLAEYPTAGRRIVFLGDMKELGVGAPALHTQVADRARSLGIREIYAIGPIFGEALQDASHRFECSSDAAEWIASDLTLGAGDVVLVKGSRVMEMERIVEALSEKR